MRRLSFSLLCTFLAVSCANEISEQVCGTYNLVSQTRGPVLGYSPESGVKILSVDGYAFKDLNKADATMDELWASAKENIEKTVYMSELEIQQIFVDMYITYLLYYSKHLILQRNYKAIL